jgi:hypothetical protein
MCVGPDARRAIVGIYRALNRPYPGPRRLRLRGLDPSSAYRVSVWPPSGDGIERANTLVRGGDDLMSAGLVLDLERFEAARLGDFWARVFVLEASEPA